MASTLRRGSFLARIGAGAGIGALAVVTGGCAGGEDIPDRPEHDTAHQEAAGPAASTDGEASTDTAATDDGDAIGDSDAIEDSDGAIE